MTNLLTQNQVRVRLKNATADVPVQSPLLVAKVLAACAMVEGFNPDHPGFSDFDLVGDVDLQTDKWGPSYSGFQIRSLRSHWGTGDTRDGSRLHRPHFAVRSALMIYKAQGFNAWSTYTSGAYKAYLPDLFPPPPKTHIVVAGDTLSQIAYDNDTTVAKLADLNDISDPSKLSIGQTIRLP